MTGILERLRNWALIKLADGHPVILNADIGGRAMISLSADGRALLHNIFVQQPLQLSADDPYGWYEPQIGSATAIKIGDD